MDSFVALGRITAHYGVKGWVKVHSYTRPAEEIFDFAQWTLRPENSTGPQTVVEVRDYRSHGRRLHVAFKGLNNREDTESLIGLEIGARRELFPELPHGQYYWLDLIGLRVVNEAGICFGQLSDMMETGANDVAVITRESPGGEILIPWVEGVVTRVDIASGQIVVDLDPDDWIG